MRYFLLLICFSLTFSHIIAGPDLTVLTVDYDINQIQYQKFEGTITLKNIGDAPISNFNVTRIYFSEDEIWDHTDIYGGSVSFTALSPNETIQLPISGGANQFGINADDKFKYIIVKADVRSEIIEDNEDNNLWSGPITIRNALVDLSVESSTNLSSDTVRMGDMIDVRLTLINNGTDNIHNIAYEYYLSLKSDFDDSAFIIGYSNWIGFNWSNSATTNNSLAVSTHIAPGEYYLYVVIKTTGQELTISDYNIENNTERLFKVVIVRNLINNTLNFDEPFGTRSWTEDGHLWSWDDSGWDNIRNYLPRTGAGHGMAISGRSAKLGTNSLIDVNGLWLMVDMIYYVQSLEILGYDGNDILKYRKVLDPWDYHMYAYVTLEWKNIKNIQFLLINTDNDQPSSLFYDDMDYTYLYKDNPPSIICPINQQVSFGDELPDFTQMVTVKDDFGGIVITQDPPVGEIVTKPILVTVTATDSSLNQSSCQILVSITPCYNTTVDETACNSFEFNETLYTESGSYTHIFTAQNGCDSIVVLNLKIIKVKSVVTIDKTIMYSAITNNTLQWVDCNENYIVLAEDTLMFQPQVSGTYALITTNGICQDTSACHNINIPVLDTEPPTVTCLTEQILCAGSELPDYTLIVTASDNSGHVILEQFPKKGTIITVPTEITITASDLFNNQSTCRFMVQTISPVGTEISQSACKTFVFNNIEYSRTGVYHHILTSSMGCDSLITLNLEIVDFQATILEDGHVLTAAPEGDSYIWWDCINDIQLSNNTQLFEAAESGSYAVIVSKDGCSDTSACFTIMLTETKTKWKDEFILYPNPNKGVFTIQNINSGHLTLSINDVLGRNVLFQQSINANGTVIDMSDEPAGIYFMEISSNNYFHKRYKLFKE